MGAGGFLVVGASAATLAARYRLAPAAVTGDYEGRLSNGGESLNLWTASGYLASVVEFGESDPWPETPDGLGPSLERLSPWREESDPQAWAASIVVGGTPGAPNSARVADAQPPSGELVELVPPGGEWRFFRGSAAPPAGWRDLAFDDTTWEQGPAGFGYGDGDDATVIDDMEGNYLTVFIRRTFVVEDPARLTSLILGVDYDDGFLAFINGVEIARRNVGVPGFDQPAAGDHEAGAVEELTIANPGAFLRAGVNVIAIEGHNNSLMSSDFSLSPALDGFRADEMEPPPPPGLEPPPRDLVLNEIAAGGPGTGWIELFNPTASAVDASGRRLELFPAARGLRVLPAGSVVAPRGYLTVREDALGFELDGVHAVILATADERFIDGFNPRTAAAGQTSGRFPDGAGDRVVFTSPTPGARNAPPPASSIVINEILYHPGATNTGGEYIELYNRSPAAVDLSGWSFTRGIEFTFPAGASLAPGAYLVLAADPAAAAASYGIATPPGPYTGRLDNDAETLLLRDALGNVADRVRYADEGSWPELADGGGASAELVHHDLENRWGPAWAASSGEGTPGRQNSRFAADPTPLVAGVEHAPAVPGPGDRVRVLAAASDERPLAAVTLFYEIDGTGDPAAQIEMADDGVRDDGVAGNGIFGAEIPPQSDLAVVAFWIRAQAAGGQTVVAPAGAPTPAFLYQVEDASPEPVRPVYRIVMRAAALNSLRTRGVNSDNLLDLTFVAGGRAYYNRGIRYRGSSARSCNPLSYRIQLDHDVDFQGIKRLILNGCNTERQWIGLEFLRRAGLAAPLSWFRQLSFNGVPESSLHLRVEAVDDAFLGRSFPDDAGGNLYRGANQANLDYRGDDPGAYRGNYRKVTNEREDDYSDLPDLCFRFDRSTAGEAEFPDLIEERIDVEEWALFFAAYALLGSNENSILLDNGDDYFLYHRASDGRWLILPWDLDSCFVIDDQPLFRPTVDAIERFLEHPLFATRYLCHVEYLLESALDPDLVAARVAHLAQLFPAGRVQGLRTFAARRQAFLRARLDRPFAVAAGPGGSICGGVLTAQGESVTLSGRAPACGTSSVVANGAPMTYDPQTGSWTGRVSLTGVDHLTVRALNYNGFETARVELAIERAAGGPGPSLHEQEEGASHVAAAAVEYAAITDPDGDGNVWTEAAGVPGALGPGGGVLRAPEAGNYRGLNQSNAAYIFRFRTAGVYRAYFRARGFDRATNSYWRPLGFNVNPDQSQAASEDGVFSWAPGGDFTVTPSDVAAGRNLEIRLGVREFAMELDAIVLGLDHDLAPAALEALAASGPLAPRPRIEVRPGTELELAGGQVVATLDGSRSHDGRCGLDGLTYLWEKVQGPAGAAFAGSTTASSVQVRFTAAGNYRYKLTVTNEAGGSAAAEVGITVIVAGAGNAFRLCDANGDGTVNLPDAVSALNYLFLNGAPLPCAAALDCNGDGRANVTDAVFGLNYLFLEGPPPRSPFPACDRAPAVECARATCAP